MKKSLLIAVFASASLLCSVSIAQEARGASAPAPKFIWGTTNSDVQSQLTADEQRRIERAAKRIEQDKERLYLSMEIEGPAFSQKKYNRYRICKVFGIFYIVIGGLSGVGIMGVGMIALAMNFSHSDDNDSENEFMRNTAWVLLGGVVAGCGIGIPLLFKGMKGKNRQSYLKRKQEILDAAEPQLSMKLQLDPKNNFVGLGMNLSF